MPAVTGCEGVSLNYVIEGSGQTLVVFLHGWAGSARYFDEVIGELDLNALRVVAMDFPGHGASGAPAAPFSLDRFARDVWTVADAAGGGPIVLVGFSMSGKFAQYVASIEPGRVSGLVLISGFPACQIPFPRELADDWVSRAGDRERIRELLGPFVSAPVDPAVFDRFLDDAARVPAAALDQTLWTCVTASFVDRVQALRMPALIVGGRQDPIFTPESVAQLARSLPCARGVVLDCNHEIPMERPRDLAHVLEAFIAGLGVGCRATDVLRPPADSRAR